MFGSLVDLVEVEGTGLLPIDLCINSVLHCPLLWVMRWEGSLAKIVHCVRYVCASERSGIPDANGYCECKVAGVFHLSTNIMLPRAPGAASTKEQTSGAKGQRSAEPEASHMRLG